MMDAKGLIKKMENSKEFREWRKDKKDSFLAHIFTMFDEANNGECQVGYYNKDDTITTFIIGSEGIKRSVSDEIFKRPDAKILELDIGKVKLEVEDALKKADALQKKNFAEHIPMKKILILQKLDMGQVYNITYITKSFNIINFKIDSNNGKVLEKIIKPIMEFKAA